MDEPMILLSPPAGEPWSADAAERLRRLEPERCLVFADWSALETEEGHFDAGALDDLRRSLMGIASLGAEPVLCLSRGESPAWFTARGGWDREDNLRCYLRYAGRLVRAVGHLAEEYVTFYAPNEQIWNSGSGTLARRFRQLSHMACVHVRAYRLIRDTRQQRGQENTSVGVVLRMAPALRLRRDLLTGKSRSTASGYQKLPLLAMARGEFLPPLRNPLRIRPGEWCDFVGILCREEDRDRCAEEARQLVSTPIRYIREIGG